MRQASDEENPLVFQGLRKALVEALKDHLEFVTQNMDRLQEARPGTALPYGMALALRRALAETNDGQPAALFAPKPTVGGRGNRRAPAKQVCIDWAVLYLTAVRAGWVRGESARSRVAQLYGVSVRQVERWLAAAGRSDRRERQLRDWSTQRGLRPFSEAEAGQMLAKGLQPMARRHRGS